MPMIRGRYYMNPVMGQALEEARAREAEGNAPRGSEDDPVGQNADVRDAHGRFQPAQHSGPGQEGPVHRMEIHCAEGGYAAHVFRHPPGNLVDAGEPASAGRSFGAAPGSSTWSNSAHARPSIHVFTNHHDLAQFVEDELDKNP
jgi:hypothetical protein